VGEFVVRQRAMTAAFGGVPAASDRCTRRSELLVRQSSTFLIDVATGGTVILSEAKDLGIGECARDGDPSLCSG
jgi:hypothetical protein